MVAKTQAQVSARMQSPFVPGGVIAQWLFRKATSEASGGLDARKICRVLQKWEGEETAAGIDEA